MISINIFSLSTIVAFVSAGTYPHVSFIPPKKINRRHASFSTVINHATPSFGHSNDFIDFNNFQFLNSAGYDELNPYWDTDITLGNVDIPNGNNFHHGNNDFQFGNNFHSVHHIPTVPKVELSHNGHITPDFSNGLAYPDPYLLTGQAAARAARILYSHELFFGNYPHTDSLLRQQILRRENGLEGNKLGSLRPTSPLHRYKNQLFSF